MKTSLNSVVDAKVMAAGLNMTVTVRRSRQWRFRLWFSTQLIRLACWISWINYEIIDEDELPELTDDERAALESIPDDAVSHWWRGEKWDFQKKAWRPLNSD